MSAQPDLFETESEESTSLPEDSRVKTFPLQESGKDSKANEAAYGPSFTELSLKSDRVGQSLKMFLALELSGQTGYSPTWREQTTPLGRSWSVLPPPERPIFGSVFGFLPTPDVPNGGRSLKNATWKGKTARNQNGKKMQVGLESLAKLGFLSTPSATSYGRNKGGQNPDGKERPSLETMARQGFLPTVQARDGDSRGAQGKRYVNPARSNDLPDAIAWYLDNGQFLPTVMVRDYRSTQAAFSHTGAREWGEGDQNLQTAITNGAGKGPLSPCFCEWLMGYPPNWTDVGETEKNG